MVPLPPPPPDYERRMPAWNEETLLVRVGNNARGYPLWMSPTTAEAWSRMEEAARADDCILLVASGFRSVEEQARIVKDKLARQSLDEILKVSAYPGYSQHHTGRALDFCTTREPSLTRDFENTGEFKWLSLNAQTHGFSMTYPLSNPYGIVYEPWHWYLG